MKKVINTFTNQSYFKKKVLTLCSANNKSKSIQNIPQWENSFKNFSKNQVLDKISNPPSINETYQKRKDSAFVFRHLTGSFFTKSIAYQFTSSSNPNQVPLLEEVQAKILQIVKNFKPSLFEDHLNKKIEIKGQENQQIEQQSLMLLQNNKINKNIKFQQMGFDSLDTTEMVITMEEVFGIQLTDQESREIQTIGMAIDMFFKKINAKITNKIIAREQQMGAIENPFLNK